MSYSLVNMSALGYDLVRLPHGSQVAETLRAALACDLRELALLTSRHPGGGREQRWQRALSVTHGSAGVASTLTTVREAVDAVTAGDGRSAAAVLDRLEVASLGDLGSLEALIRRDILSWTWLHSGDLAVQDPDHELAADVICDAAASAYCSREIAPAVRRTMASPFLLAHVPAPLGVGHPGVDDLLVEIATGEATSRQRWRAVAETRRPATTTWAPAMHEATWALHLADRLRLAADAQLAAVVAFIEGGFTARDAAYGVWNMVSGAVHATVAGDLLAEAEHASLTSAWRQVQAQAQPPRH